MIDPITAFATAQAAVAGIKKAVALGKDISGLMGEFGKFFDAKDALQKAVNDNAKTGKSDTSQALEFVMQAEQIRAQEEELKNLLIYGYGSPDLWNQLVMKRNEIRAAREKREREARRAAALRRQRLVEGVLYGVIAMLFAAFIIGITYIVMHAT